MRYRKKKSLFGGSPGQFASPRQSVRLGTGTCPHPPWRAKSDFCSATTRLLLKRYRTSCRNGGRRHASKFWTDAKMALPSGPEDFPSGGYFRNESTTRNRIRTRRQDPSRSLPQRVDAECTDGACKTVRPSPSGRTDLLMSPGRFLKLPARLFALPARMSRPARRPRPRRRLSSPPPRRGCCSRG